MRPQAHTTIAIPTFEVDGLRLRAPEWRDFETYAASGLAIEAASCDHNFDFADHDQFAATAASNARSTALARGAPGEGAVCPLGLPRGYFRQDERLGS